MGIDFNSIVVYGIDYEKDYNRLPKKLRDSLVDDSEVYGNGPEEGKAGKDFKGAKLFTDDNGNFIIFGWQLSRTDCAPRILLNSIRFDRRRRIEKAFNKYGIFNIGFFHFGYIW